MRKPPLPVPHRSKALADRVALAERAEATAAAAVAPRTRAAYDEGWAAFTTWCTANGESALPARPSTVVLFLQAEADRGMSLSTIRLRSAAITFFHTGARPKEEPPTRDWAVRKFLGGLRRIRGVKQNQKTALRVEHLQKMMPFLEPRDRAIILIGFTTALRRSDLAEMRPEHVKLTARGLLIHVPRSKTDQEGRGFYLGVHRGAVPATCPVRAYEMWMTHRATLGDRLPRPLAVFGCTAKTIARVVKRAVKSIGLDPSGFSGHSLRAGLVTEAKARGKSRDEIRRTTQHKSDAMLDRYDRPEDAFERNVTKDLGL